MDEQTKIPVFKGALIYGLIVGLATIVFGLLLYFMDQSLETWAMIASPIIFLILIVGSLIMFKKEYGNGYAPYGKLVLVSLIVGIVASILTAIYSFAIYEMDDAYLQDTKYFAIEKIDEQFDKTDARLQERMSDSEYDTIESRLRQQRKRQINKIKDRTPASFALGGIFNTIFMAVLIGLIAGIFIKKKFVPVVPEAASEPTEEK
jgi:Zn-dependent protease with chaperone function